MVDESHVGYQLPQITSRVEPGRLRFFRQVVGGGASETNAIPPTYLFSLALLDADRPLAFIEDIDVPIGAVLHGEQSFRYHAPVRIGDTVTFQGRVSSVSRKKGGALTFVVQDIKVTNQYGIHVADMRRTLIVRNDGKS